MQDVRAVDAEDAVEQVDHGARAVHAVRAVDEHGAAGVGREDLQDLGVGADHRSAVRCVDVALVDEVVVHRGVVAVVAVGAEHRDVDVLRARMATSGFAATWVGVRRSMTRSTWYLLASVCAPAAVTLSSDSERMRREASTRCPPRPVKAPSSRPFTIPGTSVIAWSCAVRAGWAPASAWAAADEKATAPRTAAAATAVELARRNADERADGGTRVSSGTGQMSVTPVVRATRGAACRRRRSRP